MTLEASRKVSIFSKGLTHGFGQNFQIFFQFVFLQKRLKVPFDYLQKRKQPFLDYKNDIISKSGKIGIFSKGLTHGFGEDFQIFFQFVFL